MLDFFLFGGKNKSMNFYRLPIFAESWNVAYRKKIKGCIIENTNEPFIVIKNSFRYWAADPFVFEFNGRVYIFAELYDYVLRRGVLGYCTVENGKTSKWKPIIVESYHMSYPYIFKKGDDVYIMPEANASGSLYIYKAVEFPDKWVKEKVIRKKVKFADTTPFYFGDNCLALTYQVNDPYNPKLYLLDLQNQDNDKELDLDNVNLRRPAGRFQEKSEIRVAQNCFDFYGQGIIFYKYKLDNDFVYSEEEIKRFYPEDLVLSKKMFLDGMHTYNYSENYEVIDIKTRRFNLLNFVSRIYGKLINYTRR